jgi:hypothetical protein
MVRFDEAHATESGDYYQVLFERGGERGEYLLIQRQFEFPDGGCCYIETHDMSPSGHFRIVRATLSPHCLVLGCANGLEVEATFNAKREEYRDVLRILKIMLPNLEVAEAC